MRDVGVVLAGGGGKGAYELGVWLSMQDMIKKLTLNVAAFSGASVGALNAALFACDTPEYADKVWSQVSMKKILTPDLEKFVSNMPTASIVGFFSRVIHPITMATGAIEDGMKLYKNGIFSRDGLAEMLKEAHIPEKIDNSKSQVLACCKNMKTKQAEYIQINGENCIELLLASSALPLIFESQKIEEDFYKDGGLKDNLPIIPLITGEKKIESIKKIIVIHLNTTDRSAIKDIDYSGYKIYHIFPKKSFRGIELFDFTQKGIQKRKNLGIQDMKKEYKSLPELRELFGDKSSKEVHFARGKFYDSLDEMYEDIEKIESVEKISELSERLNGDESKITIKNKKIAQAIESICVISPAKLSVIIASLVATAGIIMISGGTLALPTLPAQAFVAAPIVGAANIPIIVNLIIASGGSAAILYKIRKYKCIKLEDGSLILISKEKGDNKIEKNEDNEIVEDMIAELKAQ